MTEDTFTLDDAEQHLSERRLQAQNRQAEVASITPQCGERTPGDASIEGVTVVFQSVAGDEATDWLPLPDDYRPAESDLVTLLEYTGTEPNDLRSLEGQRAPYDGRVRYDVMRQVLASAAEAHDDWDREKRQRKAQGLLDGGL
jgi:hypothetical protein